MNCNRAHTQCFFVEKLSVIVAAFVPRSRTVVVGSVQVGDQSSERAEIVAKDISTPPHQSEMWKRVSYNYGKALVLQPTNIESFLGKIFADGEWLDRWQRFHAVASNAKGELEGDNEKPSRTVAVPPVSDEDGPLPPGAFLAGDGFRTAISEFYTVFEDSQQQRSAEYIESSLRFVREKTWTRATNRPIDAVAVDEAIEFAPHRGMVLEFGVFEGTTIRDLSLYVSYENH